MCDVLPAFKHVSEDIHIWYSNGTWAASHELCDLSGALFTCSQLGEVTAPHTCFTEWRFGRESIVLFSARVTVSLTVCPGAYFSLLLTCVNTVIYICNTPLITTILYLLSKMTSDVFSEESSVLPSVSPAADVNGCSDIWRSHLEAGIFLTLLSFLLL